MTKSANQDRQHKQSSTDSLQDMPFVSSLNPAMNIPDTPPAKQQTTQGEADDADDAVQAILQARDEGPNQC